MALIDYSTSSSAGCTLALEACLSSAAGNFAGRSALFGDILGHEQATETRGGPRPSERLSCRRPESRVPEVAVLNPFVPDEVRQQVAFKHGLENINSHFWQRSCTSQIPELSVADAVATSMVFAEGEVGGPMLPRAHFASGSQSQASGSRSLLPCCFMSAASALGALAVGVQPGERVLDLCAGPGAKALVLATLLFASPTTQGPWLQSVGLETGLLQGGPPSSAGLLVCNEPNRSRAGQLAAALASFLPADILGGAGPGRLVITQVEATERAPLPLKRLGPFDQVLVDPPFAAVHAGAHGDREGAELAEKLLRCASQLVRPGGIIVYCTSSGEDRDNDGVVRRFLRRCSADFEVLPPADVGLPGLAKAEATEFGTVLLTTGDPRSGPLYLARLRKTA
ncbi:unnamed protein product [Polarella glacialis]|uniref:SAM-dependent MTase RsmB/NOP-type domain-containing protein n=1 Tax=Polarella glacialis TaxID=89957 RepID=A0A813LH94_POLGL|nr:unnamed protein product [Polarella glacialis]CAE8728528.1 unnamed protein product [Polarella glacialis]